MSEESKEIDQDFMPCEGLDYRTKAPYCAHCCKSWASVCFFSSGPPTPPKPVKQCGGCKLVYYCSRECQLADRPCHKRMCKTIKKQRELVASHEEKIRAEGYFETHVGDFWQEAFPYVKARYDLALLIHPVAFHSNILDNWKEMNSHLQELLRLTHNHEGNDFGMTIKFAMFLLHQGRDDDSYSLTRYHLQRFCSDDPDATLATLHEGSVEGDWIYPKEENCRYNDIFQDCPNMGETFSEKAYLLTVLLLIKKRVFSMFLGRTMAFNAFTMTDAGQRLLDRNADIRFHIGKFLTGYGVNDKDGFDRWFQSQDEQLDELARRVDALNHGILPALGDKSRQILRQPMPPFEELKYGNGQVWAILNDCNKHLDCLPGIEENVERWIRMRR